jgi:putative hydrolases of HD superfamily
MYKSLFINIWEEFEAGETNEAKFAKSIDRLEPLLQNISNNRGAWAEFNVKYEKCTKKRRLSNTGLKEYGSMLKYYLMRVYKKKF